MNGVKLTEQNDVKSLLLNADCAKRRELNRVKLIGLNDVKGKGLNGEHRIEWRKMNLT